MAKTDGIKVDAQHRFVVGRWGAGTKAQDAASLPVRSIIEYTHCKWRHDIVSCGAGETLKAAMHTAACVLTGRLALKVSHPHCVVSHSV